MIEAILGNLPTDSIFLSLLMLIAVGAFAGFIAGLFGIGGGVVIVPLLYYIFTLADVDEGVRMHLAVGTSLGNIVLVSIISAVSHSRKNAVDLEIVKFLASSLITGVILGSIAIAILKGSSLILIYSIILIIVAFQFFFWRDTWEISPEFPKNIFGRLCGSLIGFLSVLIGVGGGSMSIPFLKMYGFQIHKAIGTAAAFGVIIAIPGAAGFMIAGISNNVILPYSIGYINFLGLLMITPITILSAPFGVRFAHSLSKDKLNLIFGFFILLMAIRFFMEWLNLTS